MRHIIPISGKDSAATALVQMAREPDLPYEFVFQDVGMELPETYAWLDAVERKLGITITRMGKSLVDIIVEQNMLPSQGRRFCTKLGKIFPNRDFIGKDRATQYFGIRADEAGRGGYVGPPNVTAKYPLIELGIDLPAVYSILGARGIVPPAFFWKRLFDAVWDRCDADKRAIIDGLKPWARAYYFAWRSRSNCYMCFYQRRYEWVGLLEYHPHLFDEAERIEADFGSGDRRDDDERFYWIPGKPLSMIRANADRIFWDRVKAVSAMIGDRRQGTLYGEPADDLAVTSCGLFCGK